MPAERPQRRSTSCHDRGPNIRFTVTTGADVQAAIKAHAEAAGMDVSAYMVAAAVAQMARDDAAAAVFAALDARNQAALEQAADLPETGLPSLGALTADERALVARVLGSALGSDAASVA